MSTRHYHNFNNSRKMNRLVAVTYLSICSTYSWRETWTAPADFVFKSCKQTVIFHGIFATAMRTGTPQMI